MSEDSLGAGSELIDRMNSFRSESAHRRDTILKLFPSGIDPDRVIVHCDLDAVLEALSACLEQSGQSNAREVCRALDIAGGDEGLPFHASVRSIRAALGNAEVAARELAANWSDVLMEAARLAQLRGRRERLEKLALKVGVSGAPNWADALSNQVVTDPDPWTPAIWPETWEWARADGFIQSISDRSTPVRLSEERRALEDQQRVLLAEIVRLRTFLGLKKNITGTIASALTKFALKVRQLGAGTGKAAERHRRAIREATLEAAGAVPCWILPEWRVAEQLPSELARFDLVIIDEASQSDITALPVILRGKKLLIVGDDKQVSPTAVGMENRTIVQAEGDFSSRNAYREFSRADDISLRPRCNDESGDCHNAARALPVCGAHHTVLQPVLSKVTHSPKNPNCERALGSTPHRYLCPAWPEAARSE